MYSPILVLARYGVRMELYHLLERRAFATGPRPCSDRFARFLEGSLILAYRSRPQIVLDTVERWSGPLLLLGGGMIVVASIIHPQGSTSQFVLQSLWVPAHIFEYAGWTTILLGLVDRKSVVQGRR